MPTIRPQAKKESEGKGKQNFVEDRKSWKGRKQRTMDYYNILQVDKNASEHDLEKAYKKFANEKHEAEDKFRQAAEAYEVLSDPMSRRRYDQTGVKGIPLGNGMMMRRYVPRSTNHPFGELFGYPSATRKDPPIQSTLPCSLEDLYAGITKKMKISRDIVDINGKTLKVDEVLNIDVKRGWKKGTKITFMEKGDVKPNVVASDLIFEIDEEPHSVFTRDGNDLIITEKISAVEAFTGYTVRLTTLDGRGLTIQIDDLIHPNYEKVVPGEGMPIQRDLPNKGNLRIKFNVKYPTRLTAEQKAGIRRLLGARSLEL